MKNKRVVFFKKEITGCNLPCFGIRVSLPMCPRDNWHGQVHLVQKKLKCRTHFVPVALLPLSGLVSAALTSIWWLLQHLCILRKMHVTETKKKKKILVCNLIPLLNLPPIFHPKQIWGILLCLLKQKIILQPGAYSWCRGRFLRGAKGYLGEFKSCPIPIVHSKSYSK